MVIRHPNVEPRPLPALQGQAYVARGGIEMEWGVVGVQERSEAIGDLPRYAIAKPTSVTFVQGDGPVHGDPRMGPVDTIFLSGSFAELAERVVRGEILLQGLSEAPVHPESKVPHPGQDRGWKWGGEMADERTTGREHRESMRLRGR